MCNWLVSLIKYSDTNSFMLDSKEHKAVFCVNITGDTD